MQQFKQLKNDHSLKIAKGTLTKWGDKTVELNPTKIMGSLAGKKAYATGGKVIAYISEGELFITPFTKESLTTLRNASYKEFAFFVPLSPKDMAFQDEELAAFWHELVSQASPFRRSMTERRANLAKSRSVSDGIETKWSSQPAVATA